jgi:putative membrane protein
MKLTKYAPTKKAYFQFKQYDLLTVYKQRRKEFDMLLQFGNGMHGISWGMGFGWLAGLVVLIFLIWAFTKAFNSRNNKESEFKSALDILKERYARGEIDKEEFEQRKKDIM